MKEIEVLSTTAAYLPHTFTLGHFFITMLLLITMILVSRTVVAGTKYSSILIIVIFGLTMGYLMVNSGLDTAGLAEFPVVGLVGKTAIIALIASFFVGGQELKKIFMNEKIDAETIMVPSDEEIFLGTGRTQFFFIMRAFFILVGIQAVYTMINGVKSTDLLKDSYLILSYLGLIFSVIFIDSKAKIASKQQYILKGLVEIVAIIVILLLSLKIAMAIKETIALPQIFFAMLISAGLGVLFSKWKFGPTIHALLFAGIPVVLAGTFLVGGSRIAEAFTKPGMTSVMLYGFTGQLFWMFGGIAILIFLAKANHIRNIAPGMAGALSHSGLTGACTGGDLGAIAASRAPIMINVPFFGHIFVFSILAASAEAGDLIIPWVAPVVVAGLILTAFSIRTLSKAKGDDALEVKGLMQYSFGWQLTAVFLSFTMLSLAGMPLGNASIAVSSALSHFGLFTAVSNPNPMFGAEAAAMITFIFAMPFLVHPLVFGIFGKAASNEGKMPEKAVLILAAIGFAGMCYSLFTI